MSGDYVSTTGRESENDWYACVQCGYIGVRSDGSMELCPDCSSGLERYDGEVFECGDCGTEYLEVGEAEDCC